MERVVGGTHIRVVEGAVEISILGDIYRREYASQLHAQLAWLAEIAAEIALCERIAECGMECEDGVVD